MSTHFSLGFNGSSSTTEVTAYNDSAATNPTVLLFPSAQISTYGTGGNSGSDAQATQIVLNIGNPSSTMSVTLDSAALTAANSAHVTLSFSTTTGNITLHYTGSGSGPADSVWNTILDGVQ